MEKKQIIHADGFKYQINQQKHTANVIGTIIQSDDILIPRSVKLQDQEYLIISIGAGAFNKNQNIKIVRFAENSEIRTIEKESFSSSTLEKIKIPPHVQQIGDRAFFTCKKLQMVEFLENSELQTIGNFAFSSTSLKKFTIPPQVHLIQDGCFRYNPQLSIIHVSPNNKHYLFKDSYLLYKESEKSDIYDTLVYSKSDVENVVIPSTIKSIGAYAFDGCKGVKTVDFSNKSELKWIENYAFNSSSIETIKIPCHVQRIGEYAFASCNKLKCIEFSENSELKLIDNFAFYSSSIEKVAIPSSVRQIGEATFSVCNDLKCVDFSKKSELHSIDKSAFASSGIVKMTIPPTVTQIGERCFSFCKSLKIIDFVKNSELRAIENYTFYSSAIERLFVPSKVRVIGEFAIASCEKLTAVNFDDQSELIEIENEAFSASSCLIQIEIPAHVRSIGDNVFSKCKKLETVNFTENSELKTIGNLTFSYTPIKTLTIPSKVDSIKDGCFKSMSHLTTFSVPEENCYYKFVDDSFLVSKSSEKSDTFDKLLFARRDIVHAVIPPYINEISVHSFDCCKNLKYIQFSIGTQISFIHRDVFKGIQLNTIVVPSKLANVRVFLKDDSELFQLGIIDEKVLIDRLTFSGFRKLACLSLPNAEVVEIEKGCDNFRILMPLNTELKADNDTQKEHKIRRVYDQLLQEKIFPSKEDEINFLHQKVDFLSGPNSPVKKQNT